jgi:phosphoribosylanthranilate isomerase
MTRVKICGITNIEDAVAAVEYGADALGFIRVEESPRFVDDLKEIARQLPPFVLRVGVFRDATEWHVDPYVDPPSCFDACQYYSWTGGKRERWAPKYIMGLRVKDESSLVDAQDLLGFADALLLDAYCPDKLGGSGETFNWDVAVKAKEQFGLPIILAGGLTSDNVGEAVRRVRPYAVDVSSGVESAPGRKDHGKLKAFMDAVRAADL